ncbi:MAG TPA: hypothetical protein DHV51_03940 [Opitutae bacterium]|nr:hypothetical protein [Opitutae bacterium]
MSESSINLSELQQLTLGPNWDVKAKQPVERQESRRPQQRPRREHFRKEQRAPFVPNVDVLFYPSDKPFQVLTKAIRTSCKTYELFHIAQLLLEKPERFVVVIKSHKAEQTPPFYCSMPDGMPFECEDEAIEHVLEKHADRFFNVESVELDAPKGSFQMINKCGVTGALLAPPNYHRYSEILRSHHQSHCPHMPFEAFVSRVESDRSPETIAAWSEQMKKGVRYTVKNVADGQQPEVFQMREEARRYLVRLGNSVIRATDTVRLEGEQLAALPKGHLCRCVEYFLEKQRTFPLETANNLRGRLRRLNFNIYKRGNKGTSFVCMVKRKFRTENSIFAEGIQALIDFVEKHPKMPVNDLPKAYLGLQQEEGVALNPEQANALKQLHIDLKWLVHEGFVVEFENGTLFAAPVVKAASIAGREPADIEEESPDVVETTDVAAESAVIEESAEEASPDVSEIVTTE